MDKISLLIPSLNRHERFKLAIESFIKTADNIGNLEIVVGVEFNDVNTCNAYNKIKAKYDEVNWNVVVFDKQYDLIEKYNLLYQASVNDIIFGIADDNIMVTDKWDMVIMEEFNESIDKILCLVINDGALSDQLYRHFCISRKWIDAIGYYMNGNFKHYFIDNIITATSRCIKRDKYMNNIVMEHNHPVFGTASVDNTYKMEYNKFGIDEDIFKKFAEAIVKYEVNTLKNVMVN